MSGGSAKSSGKTPADEPPDEPKHATCLKTFLIAGFKDVLLRAFPDRYKRLKQPKFLALGSQQIIADIQHATGYKLCDVLNDELTTYQEMKKAHDDFGKRHNMPKNRIITFHGSTLSSLSAIRQEGFDPEKSIRNRWGKGAGYVTECGKIALRFAQPDKMHRQYILGGFSHLGFMKGENQIPVGSQGQTDFGVRADGTSHTTLRSRDGKLYCLKYGVAFESKVILGFKIPEQPSKFALTHSMYHPDAWRSMKTRFPGLVEHKQKLVAARIKKMQMKRCKALRRKKWMEKVGTRPLSERNG
jgi:hypothetical protein